MNRLGQNRLFLQLVFTFVAAFSVAALSIVLITEAVRSAESVVVGEANQTVATAIRELRQQYQDRVSSDPSWSALPAPAQDVSLRAITQTVLRSYPGVEGGFYEKSGFLGYAFPTHDTGSIKTDVPAAERNLIISLAQRSQKTNGLVQQLLRGRTDLLVMAAVAEGRGATVIWAMKRLVGRNTPGVERREVLLVILVLAALLSIVGTLATGLSLARGVAQIKNGLSALERDFEFHIPERSDELGGISRSINRMASVRRKLEDEIRREDRLRALGRLATGLAHEIRNPLNSIRLTVQLLEHRWKTNAIRQEDLQTVRREVDRLSTLLNDLLDLQRSRQSRRQQQPVSPILQHCVHLLEKQADMQNTPIYLEMPENPLYACIDEQQLTQALVNLLLNALEASPSGGVINVRVFEEQGTIGVQVRDQGPGLGPEQQEHLFEPFYSTKTSGTGLGLAVSREVMRSQGGDLLYTPDGGGTVFQIQLPRS